MIRMGEHIKNFLERKDVPLTNYHSPLEPFNAQRFFSNPVAYYPGSANDGFLIEKLNQDAACMHFVYADYLYFEKEKLTNGLRTEAPGHVFRGYKLVLLEELQLSDLLSQPHHPTIRLDNDRGMTPHPQGVEGFAVVATFERNKDADPSVGSQWFKVLFICGDGIATYDALFTSQNGNYPPPIVVLIEDYGFGGNYDTFGQGGLLEKIVSKQRNHPPFMIFGHSKPWSGYSPVNEVQSETGGMHGYVRSLYSYNF